MTFYRQSDVPEVTELTWYLGCLTPYPMLANAHSFKDKSDRLSDVNAGLFYYPVLMTADIVLYDAHYVPVGKDQVQHLEIARDIANAFNRTYGEDTFVVPERRSMQQVMVVPGTDGQKMSKSYGNTINVFADEKELKKQVMGIVSDSKTLEEPKDPERQHLQAVRPRGFTRTGRRHAGELPARQLRLRPCEEGTARRAHRTLRQGARDFPSADERQG